MPFKVYKDQCKNCLLSSDAIVSPDRVKDIIQECKQNQKHFVCHTASIKGEDICCKKFYDELGHTSQMIRIAERLNMVEIVEREESKKLPTWKEMNK